MELRDFWQENRRFALAFSGGVDSTYLLYAALQAGADFTAYYVKSEFQPQWEFAEAQELAQELAQKPVQQPGRLKILSLHALAEPAVAANGPQRCYHCKKRMFALIAEAAAQDGYSLIIDGTNASDDADKRPGMRALAELAVRSPLRECGLTKEEVRRLSRAAGLRTWDKPAYACLATRVRTGEELTAAKLAATEKAEEYLFSLGLRDFRVRQAGGAARLQVRGEQLTLVLAKREKIVAELKKYYETVTLDLEVRK